MGLGLHSHFQSSWVKGWEGYEKPYTMCDNQKLIGEKKCPTIKLELFFISIGIIAFVCSLGWLIVGVAYINTKFYPKFLKWIEILYHVTFGVLLVVGGGMYIVSSEQIMKLIGTDEEFEEANPGLEANFLRLEKLAAAVSLIHKFLDKLIFFLKKYKVSPK